VNQKQYQSYGEMFQEATGFNPFPFQTKLADSLLRVKALKVPTGAGKTASVVLGWVWNKFFSRKPINLETPRRLVYCLPMRVLVEQTYENIVKWLDNLELLSGKVIWSSDDETRKLVHYDPFQDGTTNTYSTSPNKAVKVFKLMGGVTERNWDMYPEYNQIIVGTQDMLLSRALNRGYAMSRFRWPVQYGLLNNDCLWVLDEVQLMGSGFSTSVQLQSFREKNGTFFKCHTIWMSATCEPDWLETVDHTKPDDDETLVLSTEDLGVEALKKRYSAVKKLEYAGITLKKKEKREVQNYIEALSEKALELHTGNISLVIVNTVERAQSLYQSLKKKAIEGTSPDIKLIHSRFRPVERTKLNNLLNERPEDPSFPVNGRIIVSTQVIEAGVDISSNVLISELAPWASMVQRFGRLNRFGEYDDAKAVWIDIGGKEVDTLALPYTAEELEKSRDILKKLESVSIESIVNSDIKLEYVHKYVIRLKDFLELFDTTPDISGNDVDVSRFIRDTRDTDVKVYWRRWGKLGETRPIPSSDIPRPSRDELCSVPISSFKRFMKKNDVWRWDHVNERWVKPFADQVFPGLTFLIHSDSGGYDAELGWSPNLVNPVEPVPIKEHLSNESILSDQYVAQNRWLPLVKHSEDVVNKVETLIESIGVENLDDFKDALIEAAVFHDAGKAHPVFQEAAINAADENEKKEKIGEIWGKVGGKGKFRYARKFFRHELVSALLIHANRAMVDVPEEKKDLVMYLVACHHGKIRGCIRSIPGEPLPWKTDQAIPEGIRFALGIWEGDIVPQVELPRNKLIPETRLNLELMELGLLENGKKPWIEIFTELRDEHKLGPLRLGYLEAILRVADWRASMEEVGS